MFRVALVVGSVLTDTYNIMQTHNTYLCMPLSSEWNDFSILDTPPNTFIPSNIEMEAINIFILLSLIHCKQGACRGFLKLLK